MSHLNADDHYAAWLCTTATTAEVEAMLRERGARAKNAATDIAERRTGALESSRGWQLRFELVQDDS